LRLDGLTIWRIQCTKCRAVFTVLPHFVVRYRKMKAIRLGFYFSSLFFVCFNPLYYHKKWLWDLGFLPKSQA